MFTYGFKMIKVIFWFGMPVLFVLYLVYTTLDLNTVLILTSTFN